MQDETSVEVEGLDLDGDLHSDETEQSGARAFRSGWEGVYKKFDYTVHRGRAVLLFSDRRVVPVQYDSEDEKEISVLLSYGALEIVPIKQDGETYQFLLAKLSNNFGVQLSYVDFGFSHMQIRSENFTAVITGFSSPLPSKEELLTKVKIFIPLGDSMPDREGYARALGQIFEIYGVNDLAVRVTKQRAKRLLGNITSYIKYIVRCMKEDMVYNSFNDGDQYGPSRPSDSHGYVSLDDIKYLHKQIRKTIPIFRRIKSVGVHQGESDRDHVEKGIQLLLEQKKITEPQKKAIEYYKTVAKYYDKSYSIAKARSSLARTV